MRENDEIRRAMSGMMQEDEWENMLDEWNNTVAREDKQPAKTLERHEVRIEYNKAQWTDYLAQNISDLIHWEKLIWTLIENSDEIRDSFLPATDGTDFDFDLADNGDLSIIARFERKQEG